MKKAVMLCTFWIGTCLPQGGSHVITFFIRPLPHSLRRTAQDETAYEKMTEQMNTPGKILKSIVKKELNPLLLYSGIYAAYGGAFTHSTADGQVLFERQTAEPKLHVLITEDIKAVPVNPLNNKTIYGFLPDPNAKAAQFLFELIQDPETGLYEWNVTPEPIKKRLISPDTIIIFAQPKNIIVPLGPSATTPSENLMLPDFYAGKKNKTAANAFRFLKVRHYFAPVKFEMKFPPDEYQQKITS